MIRVGVDIGGTHTDVVVIGERRLEVLKVPSTKAAPEQAVHRAVDEIELDLASVELFAHGTTIATNAVIERTGARTGLITTAGFRDVLQIRRTTRGELYDFQWDPPAELVPRRWRREVAERTSADGTVLRKVDLEAAVEAAEQLISEGVESIAIAFVNSYRNPENERACSDSLRAALPDIPLYVSAELLPAWREFERTSTVVVGAYVGPVLTSYLEELEAALQSRGYRFDLMTMLSNGGLATARSAIRNPASTLMSGPAAGVIAQVALAEAVGIRDLVGMDIGGTSTDISLVEGGAPRMKSEFEVEFGTVVAFPMIDINSIGAGGGTVAWLDTGGMLHCGPRSVGADPGPACYDRGGTEPTVTDAHVVVGRLNPEHLLGGRMPISAVAARAPIADLGRRCGLDTTQMAAGILRLTVANIAAATRQLTVERGVNPRDLALVAYGGGGPLLACDVATELEMPRVLVPPQPGLTSALGLLLTDIRHDFVRTFLRIHRETGWQEIAGAFESLVALGDRALEREGLDRSRRRLVLAADLRYAGQTHELTVTLGERYDRSTHQRLRQLLRYEHLTQYGHAPDESQDVEIVNLRVAAYGLMPRPAFDELRPGPEPEPVAVRPLFLDGTWHDAIVYERTSLPAQMVFSGPAILEQLDSTTVVPTGWAATVDRLGSLILRAENAA